MNRKRIYYFVAIAILILIVNVLYDRIVKDEAYYEKVFRKHEDEFNYFSSVRDSILSDYSIAVSYTISYTAKGLFWQTCKSLSNNVQEPCNSTFLTKVQEKKAEEFMEEIELRSIVYNKDVVIFTFSGYPIPHIIYRYDKSDVYKNKKGKTLNRAYLLVMEDA